jgi:hypothetical protein
MEPPLQQGACQNGGECEKLKTGQFIERQQGACQNGGECEKLKTGQFIERLTEIRWC